MLPFPTLYSIWEEFGKDRIDANTYSKAKRNYETKLLTETKLLEQFKSRGGLTEDEAKWLCRSNCKFARF